MRLKSMKCSASQQWTMTGTASSGDTGALPTRRVPKWFDKSLTRYHQFTDLPSIHGLKKTFINPSNQGPSSHGSKAWIATSHEWSHLDTNLKPWLHLTGRYFDCIHLECAMSNIYGTWVRIRRVPNKAPIKTRQHLHIGVAVHVWSEISILRQRVKIPKMRLRNSGLSDYLAWWMKWKIAGGPSKLRSGWPCTLLVVNWRVILCRFWTRPKDEKGWEIVKHSLKDRGLWFSWPRELLKCRPSTPHDIAHGKLKSSQVRDQDCR